MDSDGEDESDALRPLPDRLVSDLTAWRTLALQDAFAQDPAIAFAAVLHALVLGCFYSASRESCVEIAPNRVYFSNAPTNLRDCAPAQAIDARSSAWKERLPQSDKELWDFLLTLDGEEQAKLLAHCTSLCVNAQAEIVPKYDNGRISAHGVARRIAHSDVLARAVGLDLVAAGWQPTLAGFVLLPFAFFGRTAFMAERVLGHIVSSGIKVLVLAVITGIGTTLFDRFMQAGLGPEPDIEQVMAIALGALTLLGLGIFGPSIANGIVAGGPQLGAGAAAGTAIAAGATLAAGAAGATLATGAAATAARGAAAAGARGAGSASAAYAAGSAGKSGAKAVGAGLANVARTAASGAAAPVRSMAERIRSNFAAGRDGAAASAAPARGADGPPAWAAAMRRRQTMTQGATIGAHTLKGGDSHGAGSAPDISEKD